MPREHEPPVIEPETEYNRREAEPVHPPLRASEPPAPPPPARQSWFKRHPIAAIVLLIVLIAVIIIGWWVWGYLSSYEGTDDAQIDGHIYPVSARIGGHVVAVNTDINQVVSRGQVLVELDPSDYRVALEHASADFERAQAETRAAQTQVPVTTTSTASQISSARAGVTEAEAAVSTAQQQYQAAQARIREAEANYKTALDNVERLRPLAAKQEISEQQFVAAQQNANGAAAAVDTARAQADAAQRQIAQAQARVAQARAAEAATASTPQLLAGKRAKAASEAASADMAKATMDQAQLNLEYTKILAPIGGVVGRRSVQVGQQVQPGQELMAVVPLDDLWVTANYKETQLQDMRIGQSATIHVDALGQDFKGHVDSFPGATGARFSLLPPENATGNFVKVVQRLPVKVVFEPGQDTGHRLRPGMSVETKVWVK